MISSGDSFEDILSVPPSSVLFPSCACLVVVGLGGVDDGGERKKEKARLVGITRGLADADYRLSYLIDNA